MVAEFVVDYYRPLAVDHYPVGTARRGAARDDDFVFVAHLLPMAVEPFTGRGVGKGLGDRAAQLFRFRCVQRCVVFHPFDRFFDFRFGCCIFECPVHQDTLVAGRKFRCRFIFEVALRGEPQPQVGLRRGVVFQYGVAGFVAFSGRVGRAGKVAEFEAFVLFAASVEARQVVQQGFVAVGGQLFEQQRADMAGAALRNEYMQRFGRAGQRHVE